MKHYINESRPGCSQIVKRVNLLVNGTTLPLNVYNDLTGEIITFEPVPRHARLRAFRSLPEGSATIVAETTLLKRLKNAGLSSVDAALLAPEDDFASPLHRRVNLEDMAYVRSTAHGRSEDKNPHVFWDGARFCCELRPASPVINIADIVAAENRAVSVRLYSAHDFITASSGTFHTTTSA